MIAQLIKLHTCAKIKILLKPSSLALNTTSLTASWRAKYCCFLLQLLPPEKILTPSMFTASKAASLFLDFLFLYAATFSIIFQLWFVKVFSCYWLVEVFCTLTIEKTCWFLQIQDWAINNTSLGWGTFPWCKTWFLWFQMDHKIVNINCRYSILLSSTSSLSIMAEATHCFTELVAKKEVLIPKLEPCQIAPAKGQWSIKWLTVSSSSLHTRQTLEAAIPLSLSFWNTGKLSWSNFQIKLRTFMGNFTFHSSFQTEQLIP